MKKLGSADLVNQKNKKCWPNAPVICKWWTDDRPWLWYKLTNEPKGSGELKNMPGSGYNLKPEDHWSCIAHLSAEDMLKSAVIEEKKFKHSPRVGADNPFASKFWYQQEGLITMVICCKFKKKSLQFLTLYTSFHDLINVYSWRSGPDNPRGQKNFDANRNLLSLTSFATSLKKISLKSDFIQFFFMILYMYIAPAPGQGQTAPRGQNFDVNRNVLSLYSFVTSFKQMSLKPDFIQFSSWFNTCI